MVTFLRGFPGAEDNQFVAQEWTSPPSYLMYHSTRGSCGAWGLFFGPLYCPKTQRVFACDVKKNSWLRGKPLYIKHQLVRQNGSKKHLMSHQTRGEPEHAGGEPAPPWGVR